MFVGISVCDLNGSQNLQRLNGAGGINSRNSSIIQLNCWGFVYSITYTSGKDNLVDALSWLPN